MKILWVALGRKGRSGVLLEAVAGWEIRVRAARVSRKKNMRANGDWCRCMAAPKKGEHSHSDGVIFIEIVRVNAAE